jgi:branched-chain amino acid transport system permease protein
MVPFLSWEVILPIVSWTNDFWLAFALAPLVVGVVSAILEYLLVRRVYNVHHAYQIILFFGVVLVIEDLIKIFWGLSKKLFLLQLG